MLFGFRREITSEVYDIDYAALQAERAACLTALRRGEPVPSLHRAVGKVTVSPRLLKKVSRALVAFAPGISYAPATDRTLNWKEKYEPIPRPENRAERFLNAFFAEVVGQMRDVVKAGPMYKNLDQFCQVIAGSYTRNSLNTWHRDAATAWKPDVTHTMTLIGSVTTHTNGSFGPELFDQEGMLIGPPPTEQQQVRYGHGEVVFHEGSALHEAPPTPIGDDPYEQLRVFARINSFRRTG